jgi:Protein of unknown function (DUF3592)
VWCLHSSPTVADNVTGIILLFVGGFLLLRGLPGVVQVLGARDWERVSGTVLGSGVAGYQTQATGGHMGANVQRAAIAYRYDIGGQTYTGNRATFGTPLGFGMGLGGIASAQAKRYAPGEEVDVWVDPGDPSRTVLRRSAPSSTVIAALGVALLIVGVLSL